MAKVCGAFPIHKIDLSTDIQLSGNLNVRRYDR